MPLKIKHGISQEVLQRPVKFYQDKVETCFHINTTVEELLQTLRQKKVSKDVYYFYAVDDDNRLYGVIPTRDILFAEANKKLIEIVDEDIITLYEGISVEHALKVLTEHQFLSVPIVDEEYRLVGLFEISPSDLKFSGRFKKRPNKEIQDIFQIIGFTIEKNKLESKWTEYRYRMPWLIGNLFAGFVCAGIASFYQLTLAKVVIISMFIPLVLTLAEAVAMQSMTIMLQFLHQKKFSFKEACKRMIHEWSVSIFLGLTSAFLLMVYYLFSFDLDWYPDIPMVVIASSILMTMATATSFGTLIPLVLHNLSLDPKIAAGPVVLMATDIMTTAIYLSFATWMLK